MGLTDQRPAETISINRLDPDATHRVQVKDLVFHVRTPTLSDRLRLVAARADSILERRPSRTDFDGLISAVAGLIVKVEGWEDIEPHQVLQGIQNPRDFYLIVDAIAQLAFLREDEGKK